MRFLSIILFLVATTCSSARGWAQGPDRAADEAVEPDVTPADIARKRREIREMGRELREERSEIRAQRRREAGRRSELRRRRGPSPVWAHAGFNFASMERGEEDCSGMQAGLSAARILMIRAEYAYVSAQDTTGGRRKDNCAAGLAVFGDTYALEAAVMGGIMLGRTGVFLIAGPTQVDFEYESRPVRRGDRDTGTRYELGWSARETRFWGSPMGVEPVLFKVENDLRDYYGFAVNLTLGGTTR